jgi:hypothetical protein
MPITLAITQTWIGCLVLAFVSTAFFKDAPDVLFLGGVALPPLAAVTFVLEMLGAFKALTSR